MALLHIDFGENQRQNAVVGSQKKVAAAPQGDKPKIFFVKIIDGDDVHRADGKARPDIFDRKSCRDDIKSRNLMGHIDDLQVGPTAKHRAFQDGGVKIERSKISGERDG